jgi:hypothetical protein
MRRPSERPQTISLFVCLFGQACTPAFETDDGDGEPAAAVLTEDVGDGVYETTIDATAEETWVYFDFESAAQVMPGEPADDPSWDLGALRFNLKSNGGTSGSGGATVAILDGVAFDDLDAPPTAGYVEDDASAPGSGGDSMSDTSPGYAFDNWFDYNPVDHTLTPVADRVYVVRTPEGNHFKVELLSYYDGAGTPGIVSFRWATLATAG